MKQILPACLLLAATAPLGHAKSDKNSVEQTLIQMEQDWSQADIKKDAATLNRILAGDWIGIDFEGTVLNKAQALTGISSNSGSLEFNTPGDGWAVGGTAVGLGIVQAGSLEMSNVDLANEFTDMIRAQRGFQANSRVITTSDEILQELVNLKR